MLTTESSMDMIERGRAAGVSGWIIKPFDGPSVMDGIRSLIGLKE